MERTKEPVHRGEGAAKFVLKYPNSLHKAADDGYERIGKPLQMDEERANKDWVANLEARFVESDDATVMEVFSGVTGNPPHPDRLFDPLILRRDALRQRATDGLRRGSAERFETQFDRLLGAKQFVEAAALSAGAPPSVDAVKSRSGLKKPFWLGRGVAKTTPGLAATGPSPTIWPGWPPILGCEA